MCRLARKFTWLLVALLLVGCSNNATSPTITVPTAVTTATSMAAPTATPMAATTATLATPTATLAAPATPLAAPTGAATAAPTLMPTVPSVSLKDVFRGANAIAGWASTEGTRIYDRDTIFDLVDGQADFFFTFGFEQVAVQRYKNAEGARLDSEVWQLATPADAYGLFTAGISGSPAAIGNDGDAEPGRRLSFWQDRYTVHVSARQQLDDSILWSFARAISQALSQGGERPALVRRLPQAGLRERGFIFFHEELAIQDYVWLGSENILGLSHDTNGIVARYDLGGQAARLLLIQYPSAGQAAAGLEALKSSQAKNLAAADARDNLLGAVFGQVDSAAAAALLAKALQ